MPQGKTVLIVEDDPASSDLYADLLRNKGYEAVQVSEGWKGMESVAVAGRPDLILMDIQLPDISGLKVTDMLRKSLKFHDIPIIAITAFPEKWSDRTCIEAGCNAFLDKPISVPEFLALVASYVG